MHHEVVCGDQGFEDHHPAGVAGPLHQRIGHLGDVHIGVLGGLDQVWEALRRGGTQHRYSVSWKSFIQVMATQTDGVRRRQMVRDDKQECDGVNEVLLGLGFAAFHRRIPFHFNWPYVFLWAVFPQITPANGDIFTASVIINLFKSFIVE